MDRQSYLRRLRARTEHIEGALTRALGTEVTGKDHVEALKGHAQRIEAADDTSWQGLREDVERTLDHLHEDIHLQETLHEAAEAVKDGAVELFREEPGSLMERLRRMQEKGGA